MAYPSTDLTWHSDPGHAWLEVSLTSVRRSKVQISAYSYVKGRKAYLEEDCDAPKFLQVVYGADWQTVARSIREQSYNAEAPIRNYASYG